MLLPDFRGDGLRLLLIEVQDDGATAMTGEDTCSRTTNPAWRGSAGNDADCLG